jgi:Outer membrane protein beta-barrel domain
LSEWVLPKNTLKKEIMKTATLTAFILWAIGCIAQEEKTAPKEEKQNDTTVMLFGKTKVLVIKQEGAEEEIEVNGPDDVLSPEELRENQVEDSLDAIEDALEEAKARKRSEPHWAGLDFGATILTNGNFKTSFPTAKFWENDPSRSFHMNFNFYDKKLNFGTPYVGLTTGLGLNFTQIAFKKNYLIKDQDSLVTAVIDSTRNFTKNKLRACYLTVPLMLEFNTSHDNDKSWYLAAGVVGGVRINSLTKRKWDENGEKRKEKRKGSYGLETFKLDAMVRAGHGDLGIFASYSLLPAFGGSKTAKVHPLNFGITLNF